MQTCLGLLLLISGAAAPQSADRDPADDAAQAAGVEPVEAAIDRISRDGVSGVHSLWQELGISSGMFSDLSDDASLRVMRSSAELDGDPGEEHILEISDESGDDWQLLAIEPDGEQLNALGSIDLYNQHGESPEWRIEQAEGAGRWLVVRSVGGAGSGFERREETWYAAATLTSDLDYPVDGRVSGHGMPFDRSFSGSFVSLTRNDGSIVIEVEFTIDYSNGELFEIEGLDHLFSRSGSVRYVRDESGSAFELDQEASSFTKAEIIGFFADDEQGFLQHNFGKLKELTSAGTQQQRDWLSRFLDRVDDSSEKTILSDLLASVTAGDEERPL